MNKKIIVITILSLMLVLAGCSTQETKSVLQEQINIAVAAPFTGDYAQYGESFKKAIDLHVKSINEKGGVKGAKINIEIFDDKNDAKEAYKQAYGVEPDQFAAVAYDTIGILAQAIEVGGTDRKAIRDALAQVKDYDGITGKISFNENRDVEKEVVVLKIEGGKFTLVE